MTNNGDANDADETLFVTEFFAQGVASAAWSWAWLVQDASRRFSVMVLYLNDQ